MTAAARAQAIVAEAVERFPKIALACSFGAPAAIALVDVTLRVRPAMPVYYLDTGLLFPETYALVDRTARRYGIEPIPVKPALSVANQAELYGDELWARDPDRCCGLRKVQPQQTFLAGYDAWLTGLRRADSPTRRNTEPFERDTDTLTKINPLYDWSDDELSDYVQERDLPLNALHFEGYPSLGCTPCTRAVAPGEDPRAGRWPGYAKTECGLHAAPSEAHT